MSLTTWALKKSPWVFHLSTGSCNNCDIEILDCLTPRFDVERFGIVLVGSIRHADALLCTGSVNRKCESRIKRVYEQISRPCLVIACGTCALSQHYYREGYHSGKPLDQVLPVDVYIPGCPPKPETIIMGVVKALQKL